MQKFTRFALVLFVFTCFGSSILAQGNKTSKNKYPSSFTIDNGTLDQLFTYKVNSVVKNKSNKYVNGSLVLMNTSYKENKQLKLKLSYFKNAELMVQINGKDSKLIFVTSTDDSIFYKSKTTDTGITLTQCLKDDILSE